MPELLTAAPPKRIAIIGGGCAGTLVAAQLLRRATGAVQVTVIERSPEIGPGLAYRTVCGEHRLNVPARRMSALPEKPDHFAEWAQARAGHAGFPPDLGPDSFVPRWVYGRYLQSVLREAQEWASPGVELERVVGEAIDLREPDSGPAISLADGRVLGADAVVLALGVLPGEYPIARPLPFYRSSRYVHSPLGPDTLAGVGRGDDLLIVGAGLTAVDIIVQCRELGHRGVIHALSRRGLRPLPQLPHTAVHPPPLSAAALPPSVRETVRLLRAEVRRAARDGVDWRSVVDSIRPVTPLLWRGFSLEEKSRFMRHVRPYWESHRHRVPPQSAAIVAEMEATGRLRFLAGRLVSLQETPQGAAVLIKVRGKEDFAAVRVAKVINCTGPRTDYSKYQHPLLINLLASGLIGHDPLALGVDALPNGEVCRYRGAPTGWLHTIGAPLKGVLWESTAVPEIRAFAAALADRLLREPIPSVRRR